MGTCSNNIRGVFGNRSGASNFQNTIDYVTIASTGNATDFGDDTVARNQLCGFASLTRGIFAGGSVSGGNTGISIYAGTLTGTQNTTIGSYGNCIYGCTDPLAINYNPQATCNDGTCVGAGTGTGTGGGSGGM